MSVLVYGACSPQSRLKLRYLSAPLIVSALRTAISEREWSAGVAVSEDIINEVFAAAWEVAMHRNPLLLAQCQTEVTIVRTRRMIEGLIAQGCSFSDCRDRVVAELLDPKSNLYRDLH
jgi:hypothetical protein